MRGRRKRIAILCEGFEEKPFLEKILSFPCINRSLYELGPIVNAKGNGSLFPKFQDMYGKNLYDLILIFCDADKGSGPFLSLYDKLDDGLFGGKRIAERIIIFVNPVTLQVVLSNFGKVALTHVSKRKNQEAVEALTGIKNYDATEEQIAEMMRRINTRTYAVMKENLQSVSTDKTKVPSTNLLQFLERLESDDDSWVDEIIAAMDEGK